MKVLATIQSPNGQVISKLLVDESDLQGFYGNLVTNSMSLAKDSGELLSRLLSKNGLDKANVFAIAHDVAGVIPMYAYYQNILAFSIDSAYWGSYIE